MRSEAIRRYVRADDLERGIWREVRDVLADPSVIVNELRNDHRADVDGAEVEAIEGKLASLAARDHDGLRSMWRLR